jgi:hypothetical protein
LIEPSTKFDPMGGQALPFTNYDPAQHLSQMGVRVDYVEKLPDLGRFYLDEWRVEVQAGLQPVIERSVLAHEAAHAEMRHEEQEIWCRTQKTERLASAMAGRRLIDFHKFMELQRLGIGEKEMAAELGVARVILRAYAWLSAPAWQLAA